MTKPAMHLRASMQKRTDIGLLREMIGFAAERPVELDVSRGPSGAGRPDAADPGARLPPRTCPWARETR